MSTKQQTNSITVALNSLNQFIKPTELTRTQYALGTLAKRLSTHYSIPYQPVFINDVTVKDLARMDCTEKMVFLHCRETLTQFSLKKADIDGSLKRIDDIDWQLQNDSSSIQNGTPYRTLKAYLQRASIHTASIILYKTKLLFNKTHILDAPTLIDRIQTETFTDYCDNLIENHKNNLVKDQKNNIKRLFKDLYHHLNSTLPLIQIAEICENLIRRDIEQLHQIQLNKTLLIHILKQQAIHLCRLDYDLKQLKKHILSSHDINHYSVRSITEEYKKVITENSINLLICNFLKKRNIYSDTHLLNEITLSTKKINLANYKLTTKVPRRLPIAFTNIMTTIISIFTVGIGAFFICMRNKIQYKSFDLKNRCKTHEKTERLTRKVQTLFRQSTSNNIPTSKGMLNRRNRYL